MPHVAPWPGSMRRETRSSRLYVALRGGRAPGAPPARPNPERRPTGRSGPRPRRSDRRQARSERRTQQRARDHAQRERCRYQHGRHPDLAVPGTSIQIILAHRPLHPCRLYAALRDGSTPAAPSHGPDPDRRPTERLASPRSRKRLRSVQRPRPPAELPAKPPVCRPTGRSGSDGSRSTISVSVITTPHRGRTAHGAARCAACVETHP